MAVALASNEPPPPGFKFRPTKKELINNFLKPKIMGLDSQVDRFVATVDLSKCEPRDLPAKSKVPDLKKWYFLCKRKLLRGEGKRFKRKAKSGSWKSTCKEKPIVDKETGECIARKRILVYYVGISPGKKTNWVIHEFAPRDQSGDDSYVICRLKENKKKTKNKADTPESLESESKDDIAPDKIPSPSDVIPWENGLEEWNHGSLSRSPFLDGSESSGNITSDSEIPEAPGVATQVVNSHVVVNDKSPLVQLLHSPDFENRKRDSYPFDESDDMLSDDFWDSLDSFFCRPMPPLDMASLPPDPFSSEMDAEVIEGVNIPVHQCFGVFPNSS